MKIVKQYEDGPILIEPSIFEDDRGYFYESFNEKEFKEKVVDTDFVQDNQSLSCLGTIRGMHFQIGNYVQAKLVRVVQGSVVDVVVDVRPDSKHYLEVYYAYLSATNNRQFFVPRGFAHGFIALEDNTIFQYKCDNYYNKDSERSFNFKSVDFDWGAYIAEDMWKVSEKDKDAPDMGSVNFSSYTGLSTIKKYKELDLEAVKQFLSTDLFTLGKTTFDYESYANALKKCYIQFRDFKEYKIQSVEMVSSPDTFLSNRVLLVRGDNNVTAAVTAKDFDNVLRIYLKDESDR